MTELGEEEHNAAIADDKRYLDRTVRLAHPKNTKELLSLLMRWNLGGGFDADEESQHSCEVAEQDHEPIALPAGDASRTCVEGEHSPERSLSNCGINEQIRLYDVDT